MSSPYGASRPGEGLTDTEKSLKLELGLVLVEATFIVQRENSTLKFGFISYLRQYYYFLHNLVGIIKIPHFIRFKDIWNVLKENGNHYFYMLMTLICIR